MTIPKPLDQPTQALLQRLENGYAGIDADDPSKPFWIELLRDYEEVCAELSNTDTTPHDDTEAQEQGDEAA